MKNRTFIFALAFLFFSCERVEKCYEEYTISGRLVDDNPDSVSSKGGLSQVKINLTHPLPKKAFSRHDRSKPLAEVYTDDNGYFSATYECVYLTKDDVSLSVNYSYTNSRGVYKIPKKSKYLYGVNLNSLCSHFLRNP